MCCIIDKPAGSTLPLLDLRAVANRNDDGFGVMWIDPKTGEFKQHRQLFERFKEADTVTDWFTKLKNVHAVYHLRWCTHGGVTEENVHPFRVLNKAEHGRDLWFMHNGVFSSVKPASGESDTRAFNELYLKPVLKHSPDLIFEESFLEMLEGITTGSRLLFMDDLGRVARAGNWSTREGCIVSNNSYFHTPTRYNSGAYSYGDDYDWPAYYNRSTETKKPEVIQLPLAETPALKESEAASSKPVVERLPEVDEVVGREPVEAEPMYMVLSQMKKESDITADDLLVMEYDDYYEICEDNPDKAANLISDLVDLINGWDTYYDNKAMAH
jgi:predicted glutamine amidotransferase